MTVSRQGADVRLNEVNLSASLIQNSNATAALVGVFKQGPIGPRHYTSFDRFKQDFGIQDASISFDGYAAADYFKEGNSLWATRVVNTDATIALTVMSATGNVAPDAPMGSGTAYTTYTAGATLTGDPSAVDPLLAAPTLSAYNYLYGFYPTLGPGSYSANLSVQIVSENLDVPTGVAATVADALGSNFPNATLVTLRVAPVNAEGIEFPYVAATITTTAVGQRIKLAWGAVVGAVAYKVYRLNGATWSLQAKVGAGSLFYIDDGYAAGDSTAATLATMVASYADMAVVSEKFKVMVFDSRVSTLYPVESFNCTLRDGIDEQGQATEITQRINNFSQYIRVVSYLPLLLTVPPLRHLSKTAFPAGTSGSAPTSAQLMAGWDRFLDKQRYVIDVLINAGRTSPAIQLKMDQVASTRADCVAFLDTPSGRQSAQDAIDYRNVDLNLNSSYSALFCSDLYETDPDTGKLLYIPPSGAMAGLMARTTRVSQPWFSIAGLNRGLLGVLDVRKVYNDGESTQLANAQVNYMRKFLGQGIPLWEQFTLSSQTSSLQFLNVRVLCNVIKRTMYGYLLYALQEQNDDILRQQVQHGLEEYLRYVQGARGIRSFRVVCNSTNNTPILVNSATLAVSVYIVPLLAVRQVNLTLLIGKEGLTISEQDIANLSV